MLISDLQKEGGVDMWMQTNKGLNLIVFQMKRFSVMTTSQHSVVFKFQHELSSYL